MMESEHRPPLGHRHSSHSSSRLNVRARNASSKNLSKLSKLTAGHGTTRVSMPRNTSKTNLRKNQSETSLQHHQSRGSNASENDRAGSSVTEDAGETVRVSSEDTTKRPSAPSGSSIPQAESASSSSQAQIPFDKSRANQQKSHRSKKRSSRDLTASGGKRSREQQFDFDREELFDDEAWVDEHVETVEDTEADNIPEESESLPEDPRHTEDEPVPATEVQDHQATPTEYHTTYTKSNPRRVSFADNLQLQPNQNPNANPSIQIHPANSKPAESPVVPPAFTGTDASSLELERDIQAALLANQNADEFARDTSPHDFAGTHTKASTHASSSKVQFALGPKPGSGETLDLETKAKKSEAIIAASDSDTSRETVVLASRPSPPGSALKPTPTSADSPYLSESPPIMKKRPQKKVQIEEPPEEFENLSNSNPSTGPATPSIPSDVTTPTATTRTTSFTSAPQYEFLSKSQRDRASIMTPHHPFPPSAWRDNFLNRATPYVNDVHADYTQKFVRRLDRRIDNRLKNVMQFKDPLFTAFQRAQERGVVATFGPDDSVSEMADTRSVSAGIGGWFSRLGGSGRRDVPKPLSKEQMDAEQSERWERLVNLYDLDKANMAKQTEVRDRPLTTETTVTAE